MTLLHLFKYDSFSYYNPLFKKKKTSMLLWGENKLMKLCLR